MEDPFLMEEKGKEDSRGEGARPSRSPPLLVMRGVVKRFGPTVALDAVDLDVLPGEVHALIGENGAGKSTLMKVLSGVHRPDAGSVVLDGMPYAPASPQDGRRAGISMIYQELNLAPHLTVEENVLLGMEESVLGFVRQEAHAARVREALELLGHEDIEPRRRVSGLTIGARQIVEIARALVTRAKIIVLDEPTSSLSHKDAERLFTVVGRLRRRGVSVIYISHFLEEVHAIADRFTVLRNGRTAGSGRVVEVSSERIVEMMVGRSLSELFPRVPHRPGEPLLELEALEGDPLPRRVDLTLHRGEILGIAGLVGAGRTETLRAVYGLDPVRSGRVTIAGMTGGYRRPEARLRQGVGFLSEDRKGEGLALIRSLADNITLSNAGAVSRWGWSPPGRRRRAAERWIEKLRIACRGAEQPVESLSGGNQQKVAVARLLHQEADVLLLDEPTRGVDVGSKVEIYRLMGELAAAGKGVVFVSSYVPELLGVADRIAVMARGRVQDVRPASAWTEHEILLAATGGGAETA